MITYIMCDNVHFDNSLSTISISLVKYYCKTRFFKCVISLVVLHKKKNQILVCGRKAKLCIKRNEKPKKIETINLGI